MNEHTAPKKGCLRVRQLQLLPDIIADLPAAATTTEMPSQRSLNERGRRNAARSPRVVWDTARNSVGWGACPSARMCDLVVEEATNVSPFIRSAN
jgi:hypothetical protein